MLPESGYLARNMAGTGYIPATSARSSPEHVPVTGTSARSDIHNADCR